MSDRAKRSRGRPKGSEIDDRGSLIQIAVLLVEGQAGNVAAAVRMIAGHDPSLIRRLQRKFRRDREALLAEARRAIERAVLERETWWDEIQRVTQPMDWHLEHDPTLRTMNALDREQRQRLAKSFGRSGAAR